jgi:hypothetical protein
MDSNQAMADKRHSQPLLHVFSIHRHPLVILSLRCQDRGHRKVGISSWQNGLGSELLGLSKRFVSYGLPIRIVSQCITLMRVVSNPSKNISSHTSLVELPAFLFAHEFRLFLRCPRDP